MAKVFQDFTTQLGKIEDRDVQARYLARAASVLHDSSADAQLKELTKELVAHERQETAGRKAAPVPPKK